MGKESLESMLDFLVNEHLQQMIFRQKRTDSPK